MARVCGGARRRWPPRSPLHVAEIQGRRTDDLALIVEILSRRTDGAEAAISELAQTVNKLGVKIDKLAEQVSATERQWQAHLNTMPKG